MKCAEGAVGTGLGKCPKNSFLSFLNMHPFLREGVKKIDFFLGKSPKLWVGGGQKS